MKTEDLRKKTKEELIDLLTEERKKLQKLRIDLSLGKLKNYHEIKTTKKTIARILTILREMGIKK